MQKDIVNLKKRPWTKIIVIFCAILLISGFVAYAIVDSFLGSQTRNSFANLDGLSVGSLFKANGATLKGEENGRTNIMIYGTNQGLTDAIILASYYWNERKLVLLSFPRDLFAKVNNNAGGVKINALYSIGKKINKTDKSYAPEYVSTFIGDEYDIPINYWVVADMKAFKQLINTLDGISITVERSFTDYQYPTDTYSGYIRPAPHFEAGTQVMNGTTALIYARSRHSGNPMEGSDFARSHRQQIVIKAIIDKLKNQGILDDVSKIDSYLTIFGENIYTNMTATESVKLAKTMSRLNLSHDYLMTNWTTESGFLCATRSSDAQYIILYGVRNNCGVKAGTISSSFYKNKAISYVQNLLAFAQEEQTRAAEVASN